MPWRRSSTLDSYISRIVSAVADRVADLGLAEVEVGLAHFHADHLGLTDERRGIDGEPGREAGHVGLDPPEVVAALRPRLVEGLAQRRGELLAQVAALGVLLDGDDELGLGIDQLLQSSA